MGRKQYRNDLEIAISNPPGYIRNVKSLDDGEINFDYHYHSFADRERLDLALIALNIDEYPQKNEYMIFVREGDIPPILAKSLELLHPIISHLPILDALKEVHNALHQVVLSGQTIVPDKAVTSTEVDDDEMGDDGAADWDSDGEFADFGLKEPMKLDTTSSGKVTGQILASPALAKARADLRVTKDAGFRVGVFGDLSSAGIVCISIRAAKLGISEEVMQAWTLKPEQYFVMLIRFQHGFPDLDRVVEEERASPSRTWMIRVGLCSTYKPNADSAIEAFADLNQNVPRKLFEEHAKLQPLFIGGSLNDLFYRHFARIIKFRKAYDLCWSGAEELVYDTQGAPSDINDMGKYGSMIDNFDRALPSIVLQDSLTENDLDLKASSFPLIAMQFALRHLVHCTEFCLVCYRKLGSTFEALKPYVCSNPLCLYHHMELGFGPNIEWEILTQPYVVDLLISFCYAQAQAGKTKEFPTGMNLKIPILPDYPSSMTVPRHNVQYASPGITKPKATVQNGSPAINSFKVLYNAASQRLLFDPPQKFHQSGLRKGDYIVLVNLKSFTGYVYHRIQNLSLPEVTLSMPIHTGSIILQGSQLSRNNFVEIDCHPFNHSFDELSNDRKCKAIVELLNTLPPVREMRRYLQAQTMGQIASLRSWQARINTPALDILRWIIASNRSCIMQVDTLIDDDEKDADVIPSEDRVSGMNDYMQFRFAQGAPDKEKRFIDCVKQETGVHPYRTIFAWHGSPIYNWHSIIREGLLFDNVVAAHGRAYGHGVYMSSHANTSIGYMRAQNFSGWPNSELKIHSALSLNEIVNNPKAFVCSNPHYVVNKTDWIQTRYLLVKTNTPHTKAKPVDSTFLRQDPNHTPTGIDGQNIQIPITAVSRSRRPIGVSVPQKRKSPPSGLSRDDSIVIEDSDDGASVATADEDRDCLIDGITTAKTGSTPTTSLSELDISSDDRMDYVRGSTPYKRVRYQESPTRSENVAGCLLDKSKTSFVPGSLDLSEIERLPPPKNASRSASGALLKAFNSLVKTQSTTAAHELGWYIDPNQVENMYQWIVELHSFPSDLPLTQDMKQAGVNSIVLEMRFTSEYPFAPPFIRVIKPRFLPFGQGGGGNVLLGGSLCMEVLTNTGWSAVSSVESILLQIRLVMCDKERPARLVIGGQGRFEKVYGIGEAIDAYKRACRAHGWQIPPAFANLQQ